MLIIGWWGEEEVNDHSNHLVEVMNPTGNSRNASRPAVFHAGQEDYAGPAIDFKTECGERGNLQRAYSCDGHNELKRADGKSFAKGGVVSPTGRQKQSNEMLGSQRANLSETGCPVTSAGEGKTCSKDRGLSSKRAEEGRRGSDELGCVGRNVKTRTAKYGSSVRTGMSLKSPGIVLLQTPLDDGAKFGLPEERDRRQKSFESLGSRSHDRYGLTDGFREREFGKNS